MIILCSIFVISYILFFIFENRKDIINRQIDDTYDIYNVSSITPNSVWWYENELMFIFGYDNENIIYTMIPEHNRLGIQHYYNTKQSKTIEEFVEMRKKMNYKQSIENLEVLWK